MHWMAVVALGAAIGLLGGMFGKGGSAIATPVLAALGFPPIVAVASPLPATIPSTLVAARAYRHVGDPDRTVLRWSIGCGIPATVVGALATHWIGGGPLVLATDLVIAALGLRFLLAPGHVREVVRDVDRLALRTALVAIAVGLLSGLLANSGGFLLAPLYLVALRMPIKQAFATSLTVGAALAVPGTIVHAALGHIDWTLVAAFGAASVPMSFVGGRIAVRIRPERLERIYGLALTLLGAGFLVIRL